MGLGNGLSSRQPCRTNATCQPFPAVSKAFALLFQACTPTRPITTLTHILADRGTINSTPAPLPASPQLRILSALNSSMIFQAHAPTQLILSISQRCWVRFRATHMADFKPTPGSLQLQQAFREQEPIECQVGATAVALQSSLLP
jgi:hypothetical protein